MPRRAILAEILATLERHPEPLTLTLAPEGGGPLMAFYLPALPGPAPLAVGQEGPPSAPVPKKPQRPRQKHNRQLRGAILDVLDQADERLTGPEIAERVRGSPGLPAWADNTIERCLLTLVHEGTIENGQDDRGHGYALL